MFEDAPKGLGNGDGHIVGLSPDETVGMAAFGGERPAAVVAPAHQIKKGTEAARHQSIMAQAAGQKNWYGCTLVDPRTREGERKTSTRNILVL